MTHRYMVPSSAAAESGYYAAAAGHPRPLNALERPGPSDFPDNDPRKFDAARMQSMPYGDAPAYSVSAKDSRKRYARRYDGLSAIDKGHIAYYCGQVTGNVFNPVTHARDMAVQSLFVDPNGISKPSFDVDPRRLTRQDMNRKRESNLSYLNDTSLHREDIMAHNLRVYNRQRFDTSFC